MAARLVPLLVLIACPASHAQSRVAAQPSPPACEATAFEGVALTHCVADPARDTIQLVLGPRGGAPYRGLPQFAAGLGRKARNVAFAMNGGMFDTDGKPIGYAVIDGRPIHALNRAGGDGNFHMLPNGVFYGSTHGPWAISTSDDFARRTGRPPDFGTQSGPMLVIAGKLHPAIAENGPSRKIRNGVGVDRHGEAHFVISDSPISFGQFARYFRDQLDCPNALFLDGSVSSLWDPAHRRMDSGVPLGPLIVVENKGAAS